MINLNGFPLLHEDECKEMFSSENSWAGYYFIKPIYRWLPDFQQLDDDERAKYKFKNVKKGMYLVGLKIIADRWVNKGFCGTLLERYGLVLDEANPIIKKGDSKYDGESMIMLNFDHIAFAVHSVTVSVVPNGTLCDVCGSDDIIEAPSMGRNCNTCNPI